MAIVVLDLMGAGLMGATGDKPGTYFKHCGVSILARRWKFCPMCGCELENPGPGISMRVKNGLASIVASSQNAGRTADTPRKLKAGQKTIVSPLKDRKTGTAENIAASGKPTAKELIRVYQRAVYDRRCNALTASGSLCQRKVKAGKCKAHR